MKISFLQFMAFAFLSIVLSMAQAETPKAGSYGYLILHYSPTHSCSIDLATVKTAARPDMFSSVEGCDFGYVESFSFAGAKSAVTVYIRSFYQTNGPPVSDCNRYEDNGVFSYRLVIKTTRELSETRTFDYDDMFKIEPNDPHVDPVVVPGVRLMSKERGTNHFNTAFSKLFACVHISLSD